MLKTMGARDEYKYEHILGSLSIIQSIKKKHMQSLKNIRNCYNTNTAHIPKDDRFLN